MEAAPARIAAYLEEIGAESERRGEREWTVRVPSHKRGEVGAAIVLGERTVTIRTFFLRGPDRGHEDVYRRLLRKNLETYSWRFALDDDGDIFLLAQAPAATLTADALDELLGTLATLVDETYESVVRLGFVVPEGTEFRPPPAQEESPGGR